MKQTLTLLFGLFYFSTIYSGQQIDTLKVIVLSPNRIEIVDNYQTEYNKLRNEISEKRSFLKEEKSKDKHRRI